MISKGRCKTSKLVVNLWRSVCDFQYGECKHRSLLTRGGVFEFPDGGCKLPTLVNLWESVCDFPMKVADIDAC